jgi:hypothetical protein
LGEGIHRHFTALGNSRTGVHEVLARTTPAAPQCIQTSQWPFPAALAPQIRAPTAAPIVPLGFDAPLEAAEQGTPAFAACQTVPDLLEVDAVWWTDRGSQRLMEFDLSADSRPWAKLLDNLLDKELI